MVNLMKIQSMVIAALIVTFAGAAPGWSARARTTSADAATTAVQPAAESANKTIVYYFHGKARCTSCVKIEQYTAEALQKGFAAPLKDGTMQWSMVDTDEKANAHFVKDYGLYTKSVVLVRVRDGRQISYKVLDKVWEHLNDKAAFIKYVQDETRAFVAAK